jgi:hypothetical protein
MPKLSRVLETELYVPDPEKAAAFFYATWAATASCFYSRRAGPCSRSRPQEADVTMAIIQRRCQQARAYIKENVLPRYR